MSYRLRHELEAEFHYWRAATYAFALLLVCSLFGNAFQIFYSYRDEPLTELVMVKDGKDYRELYFSPEDCYNAGLQVRGNTYWRCETQ